jgi:hypothetical protein
LVASLLVLLALVVPLALAFVRSGDATGPVLVLSHIADLGAALALLAVSAAVGIALLRRSPRGFESPLEYLVFGAVLGAGALATGILPVVAVAGVKRWVLAVFLTGLIIVLRRCLTELVALSRAALLHFLALASKGPSRLVLLGFGVVAAFLLCMALAPPSDWDSMMYHLEIPTEWLREGRIFVPDGNDHTGLIGLAQLLYLPLLAAGSLASPAVLSALMTLLLGLAVFVIGAQFWKPPTSNYLLAAVWGSPAIILVGMTARVDVILTLFTLLAQYALLRAWLDRSGEPWLERGAVLLGFAFGVKYQGGLYAVGLLPLILLACVRRSGGVTGAWRPALRFGVLSSLMASPWLLKNWFLFGAPFYPLFAQTAPKQWLAAIPAGGFPTVPLDPRVYQILQQARIPFNLLDAFLAPSKLSIEPEARFYFLAPILLLLPLWLFRRRDPVLNGLGGPAVLYLLILLGLYPETNLRYLIPAVVPLTIVATVLALQLSEKLDTRIRALIRASLVLVTIFPAVLTMTFWSYRTSALSHLVGTTSGNAYLRAHFLPEVRTHERLAEFTNRSARPDDRILMLFEARGLYLRPRVIEDTRVTNWALLASTLGRSQCLGKSGVTHVLANDGSARYYVGRGVPREVMRWDEFERFAGLCLTPIYADSGLTLFRVNVMAKR